MDNNAFALAETASADASRYFPLVDQEDVYQDLVVWMLTNIDRVDEWCQDDLGLAVLESCLRTEATKYARGESKRRRELYRDRET